MGAAVDNDRVVPPPGAAAATPAGLTAEESSFAAPFDRAFAAVKRMVGAYGTLAVLDVRRAAVQFAWLVAGGILISVLLVTAWLTAVIALAVWLLGSGLSWPAVLLIGGAVNLVGAALVGMRLKHVFEHVPFSATLRQFQSDETQAVSGTAGAPRK